MYLLEESSATFLGRACAPSVKACPVRAASHSDCALQAALNVLQSGDILTDQNSSSKARNNAGAEASAAIIRAGYNLDCLLQRCACCV